MTLFSKLVRRFWNEVSLANCVALSHGGSESRQEATRTEEMDVMVAVGCFLWGRSQPADSQESGMANSDHPQSVQTLTSGEGVIGGWLRVRGELR